MRFTAPPAVGGGSDRVTVRAAGTPAGGVWPLIELRIDGAPAGSRSVTGSLADYAFDVPTVQAGDRVDVVFVNDAMVNGEDRNLVVSSVTACGKTLGAGDATAVLDKGVGAAAFEGLDTVPAASYGGWIPWDAALRLVAR